MESYTFKTDIENSTLFVYIWDIKKSIVCDIRKFKFNEVSNINIFISFVTCIENDYNLYLFIDNDQYLNYVYNTIETRQLTINN